MSAPTFESLHVWQDARRLTARIYEVSGCGSFQRDYGLRDQIRRAAISAMSNIAEGCERARPREFAQFLIIAKGSAGELRSQLYAAEDAGYLTEKVAAELRYDSKVLARRIAALIASLETDRPPTRR